MGGWVRQQSSRRPRTPSVRLEYMYYTCLPPMLDGGVNSPVSPIRATAIDDSYRKAVGNKHPIREY
jgi:hypothetical protein